MTEKKKGRKNERESSASDETMTPTDVHEPHESATTPTEATEPPPVAAPETEAPKPAPEEEIARLNDRLLRLQADFDNYKKRIARERTDLYRMANEDIMLALLPAIDHLELALHSGQAHGISEVFLHGFRLTAETLTATLSKFELTAVDTPNGIFDPKLHEAISIIPSDTVPEGGIVAETRKGYRFGDKLLRAAQVVVSNGPARASRQEADEIVGKE